MIKFGDPVLCLDTNSSHFVYGTAFGRVASVDFNLKEEFVIAEDSEEPVKSIYLNPDGEIYYSVGDYYGVSLPNMHSLEPHLITYDIFHSYTSCPRHIVLMHKEKILLIPSLSTSPQINLINLNTSDKQLFMLNNFIVPFDFDGSRILSMFLSNTSRTYQVITLGESVNYTPIMEYKDKKIQVSHLKLIKNFVIFVENYCKVKVWDFVNAEVRGEIIVNDVVALGWYFDCGNVEKILILIVSHKGVVTVWDFGEVLELINMPGEEYFSLGYPYYVVACNGYILVTTDSGIVIIPNDSIKVNNSG